MYLVHQMRPGRRASGRIGVGAASSIRDSDERDSQNQLKVVTHYSERSCAFRRFCSVRAVSAIKAVSPGPSLLRRLGQTAARSPSGSEHKLHHGTASIRETRNIRRYYERRCNDRRRFDLTEMTGDVRFDRDAIFFKNISHRFMPYDFRSRAIV